MPWFSTFWLVDGGSANSSLLTPPNPPHTFSSAIYWTCPFFFFFWIPPLISITCLCHGAYYWTMKSAWSGTFGTNTSHKFQIDLAIPSFEQKRDSNRTPLRCIPFTWNQPHVLSRDWWVRPGTDSLSSYMCLLLPKLNHLIIKRSVALIVRYLT